LVLVVGFFWQRGEVWALKSYDAVKCCQTTSGCFLSDNPCEGGAIEMSKTVCVRDQAHFNRINTSANILKEKVSVSCIESDPKAVFSNNNKTGSHVYYECKIVLTNDDSEKEAWILPGKLVGVLNEYENYFRDGLVCKPFSPPVGSKIGQNNEACPIGTAAGGIKLNGEIVNGCEIKKCIDDTDCRAFTNTVSQICVPISDESNQGFCATLVPEEKINDSTFCICSQGQNECRAALFCDLHSENRCYQNKCRSTSEIVSGACRVAKDCWDKCLVACCVNGMCDEDVDIMGCQNNFAEDSYCPPYFISTNMKGSAGGFASICTEPSCDNINEDFKELMQKNPPCNKDADCTKLGPDYECKKGENAFNIFADFLNLSGRDSKCGGGLTAGSDSAVKYFYNKCVLSEKGASKMLYFCQKKVAPVVPFSIPSVEGLNQLKEKDVANIIGNIINVILGFIGSIGLVMFVYAGILWMTAGGNSEAQKKAMNILIWSSLGILVILFSYVIVQFVLNSFK